VRDDPSQWENYAEQGAGVCLGVKIINEPGPHENEVFSRLIEVVYSEESLRTWLNSTFEQMCQQLESAQFSANNIRLGLSVFYGVAAFASLMTKKAEWAAENEVRRVTLNRFERGVEPMVRLNAVGNEIRYIAPLVRAEGKLIALNEIIIGQNQDVENVWRLFGKLLVEKGYTTGSVEYPTLTVSRAGSGSKEPL
jgi:hypothetical protein